MKTAIDSYGGVKACQAAVVKIQESNQTMKKHKMTGIQALNNFTSSQQVCEYGGPTMWALENFSHQHR